MTPDPDATPPWQHYPDARIPAQHPDGPTAPEPPSREPLPPTSDWDTLIRAVRYLFATSRIPRADQHVWPLYRAELEAWEVHLLAVRDDPASSWQTLLDGSTRLHTVRHYLGERRL